ncbi:flagellar hook-length control protein FliK [Thiopseudomonas denitrificans]|uniref:Flagellar hook-length control protein FliK n=2 Tax=Thiopseudomonas denitrificans TaxID=1501432 RepID=A0A4R6TZJ2_9GAMM|nr:flagellar hook-length control protein FliK [Thiopseudomonas denitrificans]
MPSEIPASRPAATVAPVSRSPAAELANTLRMLDALPQNIVAGQQLQAQVIAVREAAQLFSMLLKLQMPDGRQASIQAQTSQPLTSGQMLTLTALGGPSFSFSPGGGQAAPPLTSFDPAQFPPGSLIQARVLHVEPQAQGNFRITLTLNSGNQSGQHFTVESPKALAINSLVSAQVNGRFELNLIPARQNFQQLAIQQELGSQFARQGSPAQVLHQLLQLGSGGLPGVSGDGQKVIQQLLASMPELGSKLTGAQLAELVKNSGIQMESRLHGEQAAQQDLKANLLRLIGQLLPQQAQANPLTAGAQAALTSQALPQLLRELGGPAASIREQALRFPVTSRILEKLDNPNDLGSLLRLAAAAISRLQTHQLSSLAQTYTTPDGTQVTTWQTEVPMRDQSQVVPLQVKFQQEQHNPADEREQRPPVWRLELSFELEPLGALHAQVNLQENALSSRLWAEQENTAELVKKELHVLRDKLLAAGLDIRELDCEQGMPPAAPKALIEQRWIDDLA